MKRTMKQILSIVLVLAMCVSAAIPVFAASNKCPGKDADHFKDNCEAEKIDTYAPKCGERGYTVYQCKKCKVYFADDFVENLEEHDWKPEKAATCAEGGKDKCSKCGLTKDTAKLEHNWVNVDPSVKPCAKPGTMVDQKCTLCNETRQIKAGDAHDWTIEVKVEPICGADGLAIYTCKVCGYVKNVAIDCETAETGGHKWVYVAATEKTCETAGNKAGFICSNDGCDAIAQLGDVIDYVKADGTEVKNHTVTEVYEYIPASHSFGDSYSAKVKASCLTPTYYVYVCTDCGENYMDTDLDKDGEVDEPALGHDIDMTTADIKTTACALDANGKFVPGKTVITGTCSRPECGMTNIKETINHTYTTENVSATCQTGAYTKYICTCEDYTCAVVNGKAGDPVADAHNFAWIYEGVEEDYGLSLEGTYAPTCTEKGYGYKVCTNPGCDYDMKIADIPALGHEYINEDGTYDYDYATYNCATGKWDFYCSECTTAGEVTESVAIEGFDAKDYTDHYDWIEDGVWDGDININVNNGCGKNSIYNYTCEYCDQTVLVIVPTTHTIPAAGVNPAVPAKCNTNGNYAWFICAEAGCGTYCYIDADGMIVEIPNAEGKTTPELVENSTMPKAVVIAKTGCDIVIDQVYVAGICGGDAGKTAEWHCKHAADGLCDATATADVEKDAFGNPMVKAGDEKKLTGSSAVSTPIVVTHNFTFNATTGVKQDRNCDRYGYTRYECSNCDAYEWRYYAGISGHNTYTKKATCTEDGYEVCNNAWCQYRDANKNLVLDTSNPTYKEIDAKGHTDEKGNPIICVAEDFWCAVCRPAKVEKEEYDDTVKEEDKEYIDNPDGKLKFWESHNTAHGDSVAVKEKYTTLAKGGMIPTVLNAKDCTAWDYILYVCPDCEDDTKGGHFTDDEIEPCDEHQIVDVVGNKVYNKDSDVATIPEKFFEITYEATFAEAGTLGAKCTCPLCEAIVAEKPYVREDIAFDLTVDSAIKSGADIVDSGMIEVDVLVNAYDVDVYSILFDLEYNTNYFKFVEAKLTEESPFGASGISASDESGVVKVLLANYGEKLTNLDFEVFGTPMAIVTLVFEVKNVNATGLGKEVTTMSLDNISVLKANGDEVEVADSARKFSEGSIFDETMTIYALGNVTKGVIENQDTRIDDFDALNWQALFVEDKYAASADINKNGELDGQDYEYICQYIVGALTYDELCAVTASTEE